MNFKIRVKLQQKLNHLQLTNVFCQLIVNLIKTDYESASNRCNWFNWATIG